MTVEPSPQEWQQLYDATKRIKELAPWLWMDEDDLFGVQDPETDELGFVSVMGALGEHYAIAVYLGANGLYSFWDLQEAGPFADPEQILMVPQLQASFENREDLYKRDRDVIKALGLKFRGRQAWPAFRGFRPGLVPWFLEAAEARFLTHALTQLLEVAPRFREDPTLFEPAEDEDYLVRVPQRKGDALTWQDRIVQVLPPESVAIPIDMDEQALEVLAGLAPSGHSLELDFFMLPAAIEEGSRPYYPFMLMMVEAESGMILSNELLQPEPSLEAMWGIIPMKVIASLAGINLLPSKFVVRSPLLLGLLEPLAEVLSIELEHSPVLPGLDEAKGFLLQTLR